MFNKSIYQCKSPVNRHYVSAKIQFTCGFCILLRIYKLVWYLHLVTLSLYTCKHLMMADKGPKHVVHIINTE
jgi:hypothetical protein